MAKTRSGQSSKGAEPHSSRTRRPRAVASSSTPSTPFVKRPLRKRRYAAASTGGRPRDPLHLSTVQQVTDSETEELNAWPFDGSDTDDDDAAMSGAKDDEGDIVFRWKATTDQPSTSRGGGGGSRGRGGKKGAANSARQAADIKQECQEVPPTAEVAIQVAGTDLVAPSVKPEEALMYDEIKTQLECPVCNKTCLPPVMQCRNGHVTCNACREKVACCPTCREIDIDVRNLLAEHAVSFMSIACEYSLYGCRAEMPYKQREQHQKECKFRPFNCPYIDCSKKLVAKEVVDHVYTKHREDCRSSSGPEITASMILNSNQYGCYGEDGAWSPRVITCFGRTFFDVAVTRQKQLHHWVWLLGEEDETGAFTYEITAFKDNVKYMYAGDVSSLRTWDNEIVSTGQCLSINDGMGRRLREKDADGKDKIRYKLKLARKPDQLPTDGGSGQSSSSSPDVIVYNPNIERVLTPTQQID